MFSQNTKLLLEKAKTLGKKKIKLKNLKTSGTPPGHSHQRSERKPIEKTGWQDVLLSPQMFGRKIPKQARISPGEYFLPLILQQIRVLKNMEVLSRILMAMVPGTESNL